MNKVANSSLRRISAFRRPALACTAAVLAVAFGSLVMAQTRENRSAPSARRVPSTTPQGQRQQIGATVTAAKMDGTVGAKVDMSGGELPVTIAPASMSNWAAPLTPDELHQVRPKLTPEERNQLRQEIKTAGEEVYEPYRNKKH